MQFKNEFQIDHKLKLVSFAGKQWLVFKQVKSAADVLSMFNVYGKPKKKSQ